MCSRLQQAGATRIERIEPGQTGRGMSEGTLKAPASVNTCSHQPAGVQIQIQIQIQVQTDNQGRPLTESCFFSGAWQTGSHLLTFSESHQSHSRARHDTVRRSLHKASRARSPGFNRFYDLTTVTRGEVRRVILPDLHSVANCPSNTLSST